MRDTMIHRGPDDAGLWVYEGDRFHVLLAHRRLAIIDLSFLGRQPMVTKDNQLAIVFNGEIFNYREIRQELETNNGCVFWTHSDTEVLLLALRCWGLREGLRRIRGMYAFALVDLVQGSVTLVRDPLGVKPLYYYRTSTGILFASEIKALLAYHLVDRKINYESLYHYLTFASVPAPDTLFSGINKLPAGSYLTMTKDGAVETSQHWSVDRFAVADNGASEDDYVTEVASLLRQSVARRMVSDVPVGAFLSGGLDSSLIVALMTNLANRPVRTYSVAIADDDINELEQARSVSKLFNTEHYEVMITPDDFMSFLPKMVYYQDEPLSDPVCVPIYYLSKLARDSGTIVMQVGEGSDEIFAGYEIYNFFRRWGGTPYQAYMAMPNLFQNLIYTLSRDRVPPEFEDALRRAAEGSPLFMGNAIAFWDCDKERLLRQLPDGVTLSSELVNEWSRGSLPRDKLARIIHLELKNRLPELLLMRVDKMSMATSIETRVPYLDEDLVEFALRIPSRLKYANGQTKYILKQVARHFLPKSIVHRKKVGFCGSARNMLSERLFRYAREQVLSSPFAQESFHRSFLEKLFSSGNRQGRLCNFQIWNLLSLVLWHQRWFEETLDNPMLLAKTPA